jgi:DHA3 family tetracycline resistance protein-like MFS transporter
VLASLRARDPALVYFLITGFDALFSTIAWTIAAVYFVTVAHLDPLQLVLLGTTLEVTYFLLEIPTGVFADTWSRRGSVIIGYFLFGAYQVILGSFPVFAVMVLATVVSGFGFAFVEGALEAWIADEAGEEKVGALYLKASQFSRVFVAVGAVLSVALAATVGLGQTIVIAGIGQIGMAFLLIFLMRERGFTPTPREAGISRLRAMTTTTRAGFRALRVRPLMLSILLAGALFGAFTEAFDRLWEAHFLLDVGLPAISIAWLGDLPPITWFAIFTLAGMSIGLLVTEIVRRRLDASNLESVARALLVIHVLLVAAIVAFGLAAGFALAAGAFLTVGLLRGLQGPLYAAWLNRGLQPATRATVLSMAGQADALGQLSGGPLLGLIGSAAGIRAGLVAGAVFLVPTVMLYGRAVRHHGRAEEVVATEDVLPAGSGGR